MTFPSPQSLDPDQITWYTGQLAAALTSYHRRMATAMHTISTDGFNFCVGQVKALRDLQRHAEANDCLGGKLVELMHAYYDVPLHPRHLTEWKKTLETEVVRWFEPEEAPAYVGNQAC